MEVIGLRVITEAFAHAVEVVDARRPRAVSSRTGASYQPGIGPHPESQAVRLVTTEMAADQTFIGQLDVPYPGGGRQRCDWCLGAPPEWSWAIEVKMLRLMGDNNKLNDNMLMHILSPYPAHRSALTDCAKLAASGLGRQRAVMIYAFEYPDWPVAPAVEAFELLAARLVALGPRHAAPFQHLIHPVHRHGYVFGWEVGGPR